MPDVTPHAPLASRAARQSLMACPQARRGGPKVWQINIRFIRIDRRPAAPPRRASAAGRGGETPFPHASIHYRCCPRRLARPSALLPRHLIVATSPRRCHVTTRMSPVREIGRRTDDPSVVRYPRVSKPGSDPPSPAAGASPTDDADRRRPPWRQLVVQPSHWSHRTAERADTS